MKASLRRQSTVTLAHPREGGLQDRFTTRLTVSQYPGAREGGRGVMTSGLAAAHVQLLTKWHNGTCGKPKHVAEIVVQSHKVSAYAYAYRRVAHELRSRADLKKDTAR